MSATNPSSDHVANLIIVGPMGVGKTTIGRQLARRSKRRFVDSDRLIEERTGVDIPTIFDIEGEAGFRKRESAVLKELVETEDLVIATGGGAVEAPLNRQVMREHGFIIYLTADPEELVRRLRNDQKRPKLREGNPRDVILDLFHKRDPLYRELADLIVNTGNRTVRAVTDEVWKQCPGYTHSK